MSASAIFTIIICLILLRVFWLRVKAASTRGENFRSLPPKDQLAVLKECLLNNPTEANLKNLARFLTEHNLNQEVESYRPFMKVQEELRKKKDALAEDNELYTRESLWMDGLEPLEFEEARTAKAEGDLQTYISRTLEGISRLYSDEAIENALRELSPGYPKAQKLLNSYRELAKARDESFADDKSLEALRKQKDAWEDDLLKME